MSEIDPTDASTWPELLTPKEASAVLRMTENQIRNLLSNGDLIGKRFKGRWYVLKRPLLYPEDPEPAGDTSGESATEDAPPE